MATEGVENWEGWAIVELMGHRKLAGYMKEANVAGSPMMRLDIYVGDSPAPMATQFYSAGAFYCITPTTEQICRGLAQRYAPEPVTRYELPAPPVERRDMHACCPSCDCYPCQCDEEDEEP